MGKGKGAGLILPIRFRTHHEMLAFIEPWCPNLARANWRILSPRDDSYQCIAWADGRTDRHMWPNRSYYRSYSWFAGAVLAEIPEETPVEYFVSGFAIEGYRPCSSSEYEFFFQKVAIYANDAGVTHMARQHFFGKGWLSKLGCLEDILHSKLEDVEGSTAPLEGQYGQVVLILRRSWWRAIRGFGLFRASSAAFRHWRLRRQHEQRV
jgi:hypothetical protein